MHTLDAPFVVVKNSESNGYRYELVDTRTGAITYECWTRQPVPPKDMRRIQGLKNTRAVLDGD